MISRRVSKANLDAWMVETLYQSPGTYRLRVLKEQAAGRKAIWDELTGYIQAAHEDAKRKLRDALGPALAPYNNELEDPAYGYPQDLNIRTLMGYMGEVLAGIVAEHKDVHGKSGWKVPAFFFRFHQVAFQYLESRRDHVAEGGTPADPDEDKATRPGRTGDDALAFLRGPNGELAALLVCEAKCLSSHDTDVVKDAHSKLSAPARCPPGVRELIEILKDYDTEDAKQWRGLLQQFRLDSSIVVPRYNMLLYATGNAPSTRRKRVSWLETNKTPAEYKTQHALEAVEIHLSEADKLVKGVYRPTPP